MRAALIDPRTDPRWEQLATTAVQASVFHHPAWLGLLHEQYRYPVAAACVLDGDRAVAGLPLAYVASRLTGRRLVALPFSDACPPLIADDAPPDALPMLADAVERERARRDVPLEVRDGVPGMGTPVERYRVHVIDLRPGPEAVQRSFASATRRNIKKAVKAGVTVERRTDREGLDAFYRLFLMTRRRLGVPTQPRRFVHAMQGLFERGLGFVGLARVCGEPAAAAVFLAAGTTVTYKYGASDERHLQARPNNLLFSDAIGWACEQGFASFDMGRSDLGQEGLLRFKRSWGAAELPLEYTYAGREAPAGGDGTVERVIHRVVTRTPPVTGRLIGELLYRHAG